mgnify:CR=1 FL=1
MVTQLWIGDRAGAGPVGSMPRAFFKRRVAFLATDITHVVPAGAKQALRMFVTVTVLDAVERLAGASVEVDLAYTGFLLHRFADFPSN